MKRSVLLSLIFTYLFTLAPLGTGEENVAKGARCWACHTESTELSADKALDGKESTRYAGGGTCNDDTTFIIDLGCSYDIYKIVLVWEAAYASSSVIEISNDGREYTKLKDVTTSASGRQILYDLRGTGRYVRLTEKTRALSQFGFSLYEFEVYGNKSSATSSDCALLTFDLQNGISAVSDKQGFIPIGDTVTLTVSCANGVKLNSLYINSVDKVKDIKGGKLEFIMEKDTVVSSDGVAVSSDKYEAESCKVYDGNGKRITGVFYADSKASGGYYAGGTGGKSFIIENVKEANRICAAYASTNTNNMSIYISVGGTEYYAGILPFSTTYTWKTEKQGVCYSDAIYFPEGCTVRVVPSVDVDIDWFGFSSDAVGTREGLESNELVAIDAEISGGSIQDSMMAYLGKSVSLKADDSLTFSAPCDGNVINIKYYTAVDVNARLLVGNKDAGNITLAGLSVSRFVAKGGKVAEYKKGDRITIVSEGNISIDSVLFASVYEETSVSIPKRQQGRLTVSLDGIWGIHAIPYAVWETEDTLPAIDFYNTIKIPGIADSASMSLGSITSAKVYFRKTVILEDDITDTALLEIKRAQFGRFIYVNGILVESYEYNYSNSYTDISRYLHKGENEIVIMLGNYTRHISDSSIETHVLYDGEKKQNIQGITDSVNIIFTGETYISNVKTAPDIHNGTLRSVVYLSDDTPSELSLKIYELGVFKEGKFQQTEKLVSEQSITCSDLADVTLTINGFDKSKLWSPSSPYLYKLVVQTKCDKLELRFGMREFYIDSSTKQPMLNGEIYFLFGTTVAINRFYEDPMRADLPWNEDWVRKLYKEFREANWECFRATLGVMPDIWYDIADEEGMLIVDEYAMWGDTDGCSIRTILPEIYRWMDERCNNPSVIVWDAQNESLNLALTTSIIKEVRDYDIQGRNWDNGWTAPFNSDDWVECHPYLYGSGFRISGLNDFSRKARISSISIPWFSSDMPNPKILNEYGSIWLDRLGDATEGTQGTWNTWGLETREQRLTYYAEAIAAVTEFWRSERAYIGILTFDGLIYSKPNKTGWTGDVLMPDISSPDTLEIRPYTKLLYHNAFSKLGICINDFSETTSRGAEIALPVKLINDTGNDIYDLPITLSIANGNKVLVQYTQNMSVNALSSDNDGTSEIIYNISVPTFYAKDGDVLTVRASYTLDGETVFSQRKWTVNGGKTETKVKEYKLSFKTNGGSPISAIYAIPGTTPILPKAPTKNRYIFKGWKQASGIVFDETFIMPSEEVTLYAIWEYSPETKGYHSESSFITVLPYICVGALVLAAATFLIIKRKKRKI